MELSIPWDIIDAPVPDSFFGDDAIRANLVRHGVKNFFTIHGRILTELEQFPDEHNLTPNSKYKGNVGEKRKWIKNQFNLLRKEIEWFEESWGRPVRAFKLAMVEQIKQHPNNVTARDELGIHNPNLIDVK